jgi:hypothetical protein
VRDILVVPECEFDATQDVASTVDATPRKQWTWQSPVAPAGPVEAEYTVVALAEFEDSECRSF